MERLEEISDENLVLFYREELETIDRGAKIKPLIPMPVRKSMGKIRRYMELRERLRGEL